MRRHAPFAMLFLGAVVLYAAFCSQATLASVGDDSASYLVVAQWIAGGPAEIVRWAGYHSHFPPLFAATLALAGPQKLEAAHGVVAAFAALALVPVYLFALRESGRRDAALLLAAVFLATPTAWVSAKGILSEPLFLLLSMSSLAWWSLRVRDGGGRREWLVMGALIALTMLTRVVGVTLAAALVLHVAVEGIRERRRPAMDRLALAIVPGVLAVLGWVAIRPEAGGGSYQRVSGAMLQAWLADPAVMTGAAFSSLLTGWTATFTADATVGELTRIVAGAIGVLALAGLVLRLRRNALDAWYVAISLAILFGWVFREETRRLLYPLLPLLLFHAGHAVAAGVRALAGERRVGIAVAAGAALVVLLSAPALALVARKALDREPVFDGLAPRFSDITEYYTTLEGSRGRALAARHAAVLAGFESLQRVTPPGARIMWMRPEYVALLSRREGVPGLYAWEGRALARQVADNRVDYLVASRLFKIDLAGKNGDPMAILRDARDYARPVATLVNPIAQSDDFVLLEVDRAALERLLAAK
jgi:hypothetical protein